MPMRRPAYWLLLVSMKPRLIPATVDGGPEHGFVTHVSFSLTLLPIWDHSCGNSKSNVEPEPSPSRQIQFSPTEVPNILARDLGTRSSCWYLKWQTDTMSAGALPCNNLDR